MRPNNQPKTATLPASVGSVCPFSPVRTVATPSRAGAFSWASQVRGALMRIRAWLRRAEESRRVVVSVAVVEERTAEDREREKRMSADVRHGLMTLAGRKCA